MNLDLILIGGVLFIIAVAFGGLFWCEYAEIFDEDDEDYDYGED